MHQGTNANQQSNVEAQIVVVGPPLLPVLHKGQKVASGPYLITVTEEMVRERESENEEIYRQWVAQISRENPGNDEYISAHAAHVIFAGKFKKQ